MNEDQILWLASLSRGGSQAMRVAAIAVLNLARIADAIEEMLPEEPESVAEEVVKRLEQSYS